MALVNMSDQFQGLPMDSLIGGPLTAAVNAQMMLANSTAKFINTVGFDAVGDDGRGRLRTVKFAWTAPVEVEAPAAGGAASGTEVERPGPPLVRLQKNSLEIPFLAIVPIPNLQVDRVNITFDMEVKSSESSKSSEDKEGSFEAEGKVGYGPFSLSVKVQGKAATHQENTRSSDNSAKYHVDVLATNHGAPEGLMRVFDIINATIAPLKEPASASLPEAPVLEPPAG